MKTLTEVLIGEDLTDEEALVYHLAHAQRHAEDALDLLYKEGTQPARSLWYRMILGRAQSILMSLLVREVGKVATIKTER